MVGNLSGSRNCLCGRVRVMSFGLDIDLTSVSTRNEQAPRITIELCCFRLRLTCQAQCMRKESA